MADEKPKLQRQMSARRRSLPGVDAEEHIFLKADADRDKFLDKQEFKEALVLLKDSEKKPQEGDDAEQLELFQEFLDACVAQDEILQEVFDELRGSCGEKNDGVSLKQWKMADFFEDDS